MGRLIANKAYGKTVVGHVACHHAVRLARPKASNEGYSVVAYSYRGYLVDLVLIPDKGSSLLEQREEGEEGGIPQ